MSTADENEIQRVYELITRSVDDMSPLSPTAAKVLTLVNDIDASPWELLQVIKMDPVLTSRVLRLLNSAHFGLEAPITSLNRALVILGLNTVKNLALSSTVVDMLTSQHGEAADSLDLWKHSLWVGVAARALARERRVSRDDQELAFIAGLLHDLGSVCILKSQPVGYREVRALVHEGHNQQAAELARFGGTHVEFGEMLARRWRFPEDIVECITGHHQPTLEGPHAKLICTVHVADRLFYMEHQPEAADVPGWDPRVQRVLQLDAEGILKAMQQVSAEVEAAKVFLEV